MIYEVGGQGYRIPKFLTANARDEYPFACTVEGAVEDGHRNQKGHRVIVEPAAPLSSRTQQGIDE
jgi:hypothetical protein